MTVATATRTCICSRPAPDDGYTCHTCTATARTQLHNIADLARGLDEKRARFAAIIYRHGQSRSSDTPIPYDPRVTAVARRALNTLRPIAAWAWEHHRPAVHVNTASVGAVALWLTSQLDWIRTQPAAPDHLTAIEHAHASLVALFDNPPDQLYLGECRATRDNDTDHTYQCSEPLYVDARTAAGRVEADSVTVTCICGATHDVTERRDTIASALGNYQATMTELVRLSPILVPDGVSHAKLKKLSAAHAFGTVGQRATRNARGEWRYVPTYRILDVQHAIESATSKRTARPGTLPA